MNYNAIKLPLILLLATFCGTLLAQEEHLKDSQIKIYYQEGDTGEMIKMNAEEARIRFKMTMLSYATKVYFVVSDSKSAYQFSSRSLPNLWVQFESPNDSSTNNIVMIKGEIVRKERKFLKTHMGAFFKFKDLSGTYVKLKFEKKDEKNYRIIFPETELMSGEYTIYDLSKIPENDLKDNDIMIHCFGVH